MKRVVKLAPLAVVAAILPSPAFAYIDPAVGSMIFQGIIGAIAVAGTAWYTLRQKFGEFLAHTKAAIAPRETRGK